jgi:hypothetical protein
MLDFHVRCAQMKIPVTYANQEILPIPDRSVCSLSQYDSCHCCLCIFVDLVITTPSRWCTRIYARESRVSLLAVSRELSLCPDRSVCSLSQYDSCHCCLCIFVDLVITTPSRWYTRIYARESRVSLLAVSRELSLCLYQQINSIYTPHTAS